MFVRVDLVWFDMVRSLSVLAWGLHLAALCVVCSFECGIYQDSKRGYLGVNKGIDVVVYMYKYKAGR